MKFIEVNLSAMEVLLEILGSRDEVIAVIGRKVESRTLPAGCMDVCLDY